MGLTPQQVADGNYLPERLPTDPSAHPVYTGLIQIIGPTTLYQWNCSGPSVVKVPLRTAGYDIWIPRAWQNCGQLMTDFHNSQFTTTGYQQAADQLGLKYRYNPKGGVPLGFVRFMKQLLARESTMADLFVGRCRRLTRRSLLLPVESRSLILTQITTAMAVHLRSCLTTQIWASVVLL